MRNRVKYGINSLIVTAAVVAAVLIINAIVSVIGSKANLKIDMTHDRLYEFSDNTKEAIKAVDTDVKIYALYPPGATGDNVYAVREQLEMYSRLNPKISVEYIDPYKNPAFAQKYTSNGESVSEGTIVVESGNKYRIVPFEKQFEYGMFKDEEKTNLFMSLESSVTNAVAYVTSGRKGTTIYFTEGHSEMTSAFPAALKADGRNTAMLDLSEGIPEDAAMLVISSPARDITKPELDILDEYMKNGGRLMYIASAGVPTGELLGSYIEEWGIVVNNDRITEEDDDYLLSIHNDKVPTAIMQSHDVTDNIIKQKLKLITPESCSLEVRASNTKNAMQTVLVKSSPISWSVKFEGGEPVEDSVREGEHNIAVLAESYDETQPKVFVLSSLYALEVGINGQPVLGQSGYANRDFIMNVVSYLCDEHNANSLRSKDVSTNLLSITQSQKNMWRFILMYLIPIAIIAAGVVVWRKRRYR